jgi:hypothetical protein
MEVQICKNILIFWLQVLKTIVKLYHFKNIKCNFLKKFFVDVDGLCFVLEKWWKFITKKNSVTSLIFKKLG